MCNIYVFEVPAVSLIASQDNSLYINSVFELDIYGAETRNKMIIWKHLSSNDNIKSKFVSVVIPPRQWQQIFLSVYYKTSLPLISSITETLK